MELLFTFVIPAIHLDPGLHQQPGKVLVAVSSRVVERCVSPSLIRFVEDISILFDHRANTIDIALRSRLTQLLASRRRASTLMQPFLDDANNFVVPAIPRQGQGTRRFAIRPEPTRRICTRFEQNLDDLGMTFPCGVMDRPSTEQPMALHIHQSRLLLEQLEYPTRVSGLGRIADVDRV
tara:strand:+ start:2926 stop:3462 length:537 start_codon:yes stop_codon:yes gene_type:complete